MNSYVRSCGVLVSQLGFSIKMFSISSKSRRVSFNNFYCQLQRKVNKCKLRLISWQQEPKAQCSKMFRRNRRLVALQLMALQSVVLRSDLHMVGIHCLVGHNLGMTRYCMSYHLRKSACMRMPLASHTDLLREH